MLASTNPKPGRRSKGAGAGVLPAAEGPFLSARQLEIVAAAIGIIAKDGVPELTTRSLAKALGVTEPALYRHFRNKADILLAILATFRASQAALHARVESGPASPLRKVEAFLGEVFRGFAAQPAMVSVVLAEGLFQNDKRLARAVLAIMDDRKARLASLISAGRSAGEIRSDVDPETTALLVMGAMRLLATRWRLSGLAFDIEAEGGKLLKAVRRMLAADKRNQPKGEVR